MRIFTEKQLRQAIDMARMIYDVDNLANLTIEEAAGQVGLCTNGWIEAYTQDDIVASFTDDVNNPCYPYDCGPQGVQPQELLNLS